jgi:hypothetical protein
MQLIFQEILQGDAAEDMGQSEYGAKDSKYNYNGGLD